MKKAKRLRRWISLLCAVALAVTMALPVSAAAAGGGASFSDVHPGDWFYDSVTSLAQLGGVTGYEDGTFRPGNNVSRLEAYAIALRVFPTPAGDGSAETAAQVSAANGTFWGNDIITHALCNSVENFGMTAGEWNRPVTREELSYLLYRAYIAWNAAQGLGDDMPCYGEATALVGDYAEAVALSEYEPTILWLYTYGIVKGVNGDGDFNPKATASRAECCTIIDTLCHKEKWAAVDWDTVIAQDILQPAVRLADGTDFTGAKRMHYDKDVAYYYCRELEKEIGIQIFYLPEWKPKQAGLVQYADFQNFNIDGIYFIRVLEELRKMKAAYDLYPDGLIKEMAQRKGSHGSEIILCPYTFEGVSSYGMHVYDYSDDAKKVDQIYYTGTGGDEQYYSHEMGHMMMSSAAILNGWTESCDTWESMSTSGRSYVSLYAMSGRPEDWAETWAYLWHQTDTVVRLCSGDSGMKAKVQYLTQLLDQYDAVDTSKLPWASVLQ